MVEPVDHCRPTVLMVAAEFAPLAKTGGLADMVRAIAVSLEQRGFVVKVLIPGYAGVLSAATSGTEEHGAFVALDHQVQLRSFRLDGIEIIVVRCDQLYDRAGGPYRDEQGVEWADLALRFGVLCRAAAHIVNGQTTIDPPDTLNLHDWHAALTPAYLSPLTKTRTILTIHNFMFQGRVSHEEMGTLGFSPQSEIGAIGRHFDGFSFLQVGLRLSDTLVTVSKGYADEIKIATRHNWWYVSDSRDRARLGFIPNWPELQSWDPAHDHCIATNYGLETLDRRISNRRALEAHLGWSESKRPVFCTVSRITGPKGFRFLARRIPKLLERDTRLVIVGDGDRRLLNLFGNYASEYPQRIALLSPYSEAAARMALAGADALVMPSLTEPCGLSQQYAQVYGCVPLVSKVGGLPDTVIDGETGFLFSPSDENSFLAAIDRAIGEMKGESWVEIQQKCMMAHVNSRDDDQYAELFLSASRVNTSRSLEHGTVRRAAPRAPLSNRAILPR